MKWLKQNNEDQPKRKEHESAHQGWGEDTLSTEEGERLVSEMVQAATSQQKEQHICARCEDIMRAEYSRRDERGRDISDATAKRRAHHMHMTFR